MIKKATVYQIRILCYDVCMGMEYWFDKELSDLYEDRNEAEKELEKYLRMSESELEKECKACVSKDGPKIVELILNKKKNELY